MIRLSIKGANIEPIVQAMGNIARPDLQPLAEEIRSIMLEDNRSGLMAGTNADGSDTDDLQPSTLKRPRSGDSPGKIYGDGPPRVPRGEQSRAISGYDVDIQDAAASGGGKILIGAWREFDAIRYFRKNRDPVGIRPEGETKIQAAVENFAQRLIGEGGGL